MKKFHTLVHLKEKQLFSSVRNNAHTFSHNLIVELIVNIFSKARKSGNISYILKASFVRHSSEYETLDSDRQVIPNVYRQMRIHMVR